jgi:hypothetical protein
VYRAASPKATIVSLLSGLGTKTFALIDIDPFGAPWDTIETLSGIISLADVVFVSNGEAYAVRRGLRRGQKYPSRYSGRDMPKWVTSEYLPRLERVTRLNIEFFYAFPTTVRVVLSRSRLPSALWVGCPQWMWWLERYAAQTAHEIQGDGITS